MITYKSLAVYLVTFLKDVAHDVMDQRLEVMCNVSVGNDSLRERLKQEHEMRDFLLEEINVYPVEGKRPVNTLPENSVAMKAIKRATVNLQRNSFCLEIEKTLLMKICKELLSCSSQAPM